MLSGHVLEQVLAAAFKIIVLVVTIVDLPEAIHVHLAHKRDGFLGVELVLGCLQIGVLKFVPVQVDQLAIVRPSETEAVALVVDQIP